MIDALKSSWTGGEKLLLSFNPNGVPYRQHFSDVRDIVEGLALAIQHDAAIGEVFNLAGSAIFDWGEIVPMLAERHQMPVAEARLPFANYFELDLTKIKALLGFQPRHDFDSIYAAAQAIGRGEITDVLPTGIRYGVV